MKRKKEMIIKTFLCIMLVASFAFGGSSSWVMHTYAAEDISAEKNVDVLEVELMDVTELKPLGGNVKTSLYNCEILFSRTSAGLHVEITTGCANGMASYLGVKDIKIEQKVWYGWKTIATGSGAQDTNCSIMGVQINYPNVTAGETYRISCVHYGDYDGYRELSNQTSEFVY